VGCASGADVRVVGRVLRVVAVVYWFFCYPVPH